MNTDPRHAKWIASADAWIAAQGAEGDWSRREVLDPALEQIFANIAGKTVLDLGCGEGRYARILKGKGALVTGIDPVPAFITHARSLDSVSTYVEGVTEHLPFADDAFDIVLSYLSLIDIADLEAAAQEITRVLHPGGQLVIVTISNVASTTPGWIKDDAGNKLYREVDRYMEHFHMDLAWDDIKIRNYHRPLSYILGLFLNRRFVLTQFIEPLPPPSDANYADERRVPTFQLFCLQQASHT